MTSNFAEALFNQEKEVPTFLPVRLRLPSGETRYPTCVTLEEIHECGYKGPYTVPYADENHIVEWNSVTEEFYVREKTPEEKKSFIEDGEVRAAISFYLTEEQDLILNQDNYLPFYVDIKLSYFAKLKKLLSSSNILTFSDLPPYPPDSVYFKTEAERDQAWQVYTSTRDVNANWKNEYEEFGAIWTITPQFSCYLKIDPTWVKGTRPIPADSVPPVINLREL